MPASQQSRYRWVILALLTATGGFVTAMPFACMPPLFKEIADDLGLNIVQVGSIWGIASLAGVFVSLIAGFLSDKFSTRMFLTVTCILTGLTGAFRGVGSSFMMLAFTVFLNGVVRLMLPISVTKTVGIWFKGKNLGMAQGMLSMGFGFGLMLGQMISATVLSPWLGGWRNVMYFYGLIAVVIGVLWYIFGREPPQTETAGGDVRRLPFRQGLSTLAHNKSLWLLAVTLALRIGSVMGMTGYAPLYLRNRGWSATGADGAVTAFYAASTLFVVPLSSISDRLGSRKTVLFTGLVVTILCMGILPFADGAAVWVLMILSGMFMDGFMAVFNTLTLETKGIGEAYAGTALGIIYTCSNFGSVVAPPIGNALDGINQALPFVFWMALGVLAIIPFIFCKETGKKMPKVLTAK